MVVTKLEPVTKTKWKVFIDEQFAFVLYKGELSRYRIQENEEISQDTVHKIKEEVLVKRARLRAMHLLNQMDRTEEQLRTKLRQNQYPEDIIEDAMSYVASFGYVGDLNYAKRFISSKQWKKSKLEIEMMLRQKGIAKELIQSAFEKVYTHTDEKEAIQRLVRKKCPDGQVSTEEEKRKLIQYLTRKGFRYDDIVEVIQLSSYDA